ncbi:MAG TPA: hypothetical protein VFH58_12920 [Acidimicrobiales bacterium]|nr:hypothetical protein [Acidimicrobiales bacterium]
MFAPLEGATVAPDHIRIKFSKKMVKDAPAIGTDGELLAEEERPLFEHYGLEFETGSAGERRLARR